MKIFTHILQYFNHFVFGMNELCSIELDCFMLEMHSVIPIFSVLIKGLRLGVERFVVTMHVQTGSLNPVGVRLRDWMYCLHKPKCSVTTNPEIQHLQFCSQVSNWPLYSCFVSDNFLLLREIGAMFTHPDFAKYICVSKLGHHLFK